MTGRICGTGSALPKLRVTNDDLSLFLDTSDEWIKSRTGIGARRLATQETAASLAVEAAKRALLDAEVTAGELDLIIAATVTADHLIPMLACEVQDGIGAAHATAFDINAGCSGFLFALNIVQTYISAGICKKALIIGAEVLSRIVDWQDRSTCVLFGDGAGAAVICAEKEGILAVTSGSDGSAGMALKCGNRPVQHPYYHGTPENPFIVMNGQEVYKFAVRKVPECVKKVLKTADVPAEEIKYFLLHQANRRIIEAAARKLDQPLDKFPMNMEECGNISAASVPILLDLVSHRGMIEKGEKIVLAGFGAGLTWGAAVLVW